MSNEYLPFCPTDTGSNLLSEADYLAAADRVSGNKPGVASSRLNNRAMRQSSAVAAQLMQFITNKNGADALDDGVAARLLAQITGVLTAYAPTVTAYLSGSGTHNLTYLFQIASGSATAGATYTNNSVTFTVVATVASAVLVKMTGPGAPAASGTLTKASGTGDATLSFYSVRAPLYLKVRMVGGGGGGAGGGDNGGGETAGTAGVDTTFGTTLLSAGAGAGGTFGPAGAGGTSSLGTGPLGLALTGGRGSRGAQASTIADILIGGMGGQGAFGGGTSVLNSSGAGAANTGAGGSGGGASCATGGSTSAGSGGGAGGYVDAVITSPLSTYAYAVGTGGAAGTAGTNGGPGAAGGTGMILVEAYYQ